MEVWVRKSDQITQFKLNIPVEIDRWIEEQAVRNMRSKGAEILIALKEKQVRQSETQKADAQA